MSNKNLNADLIRTWVKPATRDSNDKLYPAVAGGDSAARSQMIESNVGLVISLAEQFIRYMPTVRHLRDDLISSGFVGLIEAVNRMTVEAPAGNANATALMSLSIQSAMGKLIEAEQTIRVPERTKKRKKEQGVIIDVPEKIMDIHASTEEEQDALDEQFFYDPRRMQDIRETLDACCESTADREIIRLREEGYVDREIADLLDIPLTTIYVMRRTLYARFLESTGWKGEA